MAQAEVPPALSSVPLWTVGDAATLYHSEANPETKLGRPPENVAVILLTPAAVFGA